jgi:4'-phosphopantetheinyl transferase
MVDCETEILPNSNVQRTGIDAISWPPPPDDWVNHLDVVPRELVRNHPHKSVHVWAASLLVSLEAQREFERSLAPDERERAARFHFPIHRARFIAGRGLLRKLLGNYLGMEPRSLEFSYGPQGKPALRGSEATFHFNLAHSEDILLVAITRSGIVGVDVEQVRVLADVEELVARFFSATECAQFGNLPVEQKPLGFFNLWTRKEAWLKATGEGITHLLNQVEVSFLPSEPARLLRLPQAYLNTTSWSLYELAPRPGFVGALAFAGDAPAIHCWRYQHG